MSSFVSHPDVQRLITDFTQEILTISKGVVLEALSKALGAVTPSAPTAPKVRRPAPVKPVVPEARSEEVPTKRIPNVSPEIKESVLSRVMVSNIALTSWDIAKQLGLGETSVRVALGQLVSEGSVKKTLQDRKAFYELA